jgi:hypothetical protein
MTTTNPEGTMDWIAEWMNAYLAARPSLLDGVTDPDDERIDEAIGTVALAFANENDGMNDLGEPDHSLCDIAAEVVRARL